MMTISTKGGEDVERTIQADGHLHGVIVACRRDDGRWLLIRRSAHMPGALRVCFPGGGIDGDESQAETVIREMREELGVEVVPLRCVWNYRAIVPRTVP